MTSDSIPQEELDRGYKGLVHVEGWNKACCFHHVKTEKGVHYLVTPKSRKPYATSNRLLYTKRNKPASS